MVVGKKGDHQEFPMQNDAIDRQTTSTLDSIYTHKAIQPKNPQLQLPISNIKYVRANENSACELALWSFIHIMLLAQDGKDDGAPGSMTHPFILISLYTMSITATDSQTNTKTHQKPLLDWGNTESLNVYYYYCSLLAFIAPFVGRGFNSRSWIAN